MFIAVTSKSVSFIAMFIAMSFTFNLCGPNAFGQALIDDVNPMIGTTGPSVYDYGGMIPGVATPFGMTHWTAMTRENKISVYSYNYSDKTIEGFLGTHQPAIWMGDYGYVSLMPSSGTWEDDKIHPESNHQSGHHMGGYVTFPTTRGEEIKVKIGTSFISLDQAKDNLRREISGWDFDRVKAEGRRIWNEALGKIKIQGGSKNDRVNFYTAMYHTLLFPRIFSEYGRYYSAFDDRIHNGVSYNDYSLWDTFRAEHPLLLLTQPDRVPEMITSLLQMYDEGGWMPMWPNPTYSNIMISTHADSVIADAYVKGFRGFDLKK